MEIFGNSVLERRTVMNEDKMKFSKLGKYSIHCIDPQAPVFEILESLTKHGITLAVMDQVFD